MLTSVVKFITSTTAASSVAVLYVILRGSRACQQEHYQVPCEWSHQLGRPAYGHTDRELEHELCPGGREREREGRENKFKF